MVLQHQQKIPVMQPHKQLREKDEINEKKFSINQFIGEFNCMLHWHILTSLTLNYFYDLPEFRVGSTRFPHAPTVLLVRRACRVHNLTGFSLWTLVLRKASSGHYLSRDSPSSPSEAVPSSSSFNLSSSRALNAACAPACVVAFCFSLSFSPRSGLCSSQPPPGLLFFRGLCLGFFFLGLLISRFSFRHPEPFPRPLPRSPLSPAACCKFAAVRLSSRDSPQRISNPFSGCISASGCVPVGQ
ncbi:hypothetical protein GEV33_015469 [Tenebrio molitor]|uniref:Uncharacterized protein n=1 Tax=Tenebrio molitor TaxID=7067 RepID=A0A8J6L5M4_TENMO|nr:hypothetical protein GEV33_015469 [Tenebrio molitor]